MGSGKSGRRQARAIEEEGERAAQRSKLQAEAALQQQQSMIARQQAVDAAQAAQESQLRQEVEVEQSPVGDDEIVLEEGRRRAPRESYRVRQSRGSGINI